MLLFVMQTERDQVHQRRFGSHVCVQTVQEPGHRFVDVRPIVGDLGDRRTADEAALATRVATADGLVVGVEQVREVRVGGPPTDMRVQHERVEEPRRVGSVPFRRADVRHRLDRLVLSRQRLGQRIGERPDPLVCTQASVALR